MRHEVVVGAAFWFLVSAFVALSAGRAHGDAAGDETWQQFRGQVLFSNILFAPSGQFPSAGARAASLRRNGRNTVESTGGFWRLHCVAFLDPMPKGRELRVRATDVTDVAKPVEVRVFHETIVPGQRELAVDDLVLTDTIGFERGHRYEISIERDDDDPGVPLAGKRDVYAKGVVTLM
jgi:hypothetical protein